MWYFIDPYKERKGGLFSCLAWFIWRSEVSTNCSAHRELWCCAQISIDAYCENQDLIESAVKDIVWSMYKYVKLDIANKICIKKIKAVATISTFVGRYITSEIIAINKMIVTWRSFYERGEEGGIGKWVLCYVTWWRYCTISRYCDRHNDCGHKLASFLSKFVWMVSS